MIKNTLSIIVLTVLTFINTSRISAQSCFGSYTNYAIANNNSTSGIVDADFNNDGYDDIAITDGSSGNRVSVMLGNGNGTFGVSTNFQVGAGAGQMVAQDFNADGNIDLAVVSANSSGANSISVLLGNGNGTFATGTYYTTTSNQAQGITSGDFNSDGKIDLATTTTASDVTVVFGNGTGGFGTASHFSVGTGPKGIICVDLNNDGKKDLVTANNYSSNISILLGNGSGGFSAATNISGNANPNKVLCKDFNSDGNSDIAVCYGGTVSLMMGTGTGSFGAATALPTGTGAVSECADFNGDGVWDLAGADNTTAFVMLGNNLGEFGALQGFGTGTSPLTVLANDFNNDSKTDIATLDHYTGAQYFSVLLNINASLYGHLSLDSLGIISSLNHAQVLLYYADSVGTHPPIQTTSVDPVGNYLFPNIGNGNYKVQVIPDTAFYHTSVLKTYFGNKFSWDSAAVIALNCSINDTANVSVKYLPPFSNASSAQISGTVMADASYSGKTNTLGDPIPGVDVALEQNPGSIQRVTTTDAGGNYFFANVPIGTYVIIATIPGYELDSSHHVTISATNNVVIHQNYFVSDSSIYPTAITGTRKLNANKQDLLIYPNPAYNTVTIANVYSKTLIKIFDVLGNVVLEKEINENTSFDLNFIAGGVYTIVSESDLLKTFDKIIVLK